MSENEQIQAELERLRSENALLKRASSRTLPMKISDKGALSIYGLGRWPVTLYKEQWNRLLEQADAIKAFIIANEDKLKVKGQETAPATAPAPATPAAPEAQ